MLKRGKRILAAVLSMAILVNASFPAFAEINPSYPDVIDYTVTDNEMVAYFYGSGAYGANPLDAAEKELLSNNALVNGAEHAVTRPTDGDNLVAIDQENQTVKAEKFDDQHGNIWEPIAAALAIEGEDDKAITLDENGVGSFTTSSKSYSVKVTYQLKIAVDTGVQTALLNTPAILKEGVNNLTAVNSAYDHAKALQDVVPTLVDLATNGVGPIELFKGIAAVTNLDNDVKDDGKLAVIKMLDEYRAISVAGDTENYTGAKLTYLLNPANRIDNAAIAVYKDVKELYDAMMTVPEGEEYSTYDYVMTAKNMGFVSAADAGKVTLAKTTFESIMSALEPVQYAWGIFTETHAVKGSADKVVLGAAVDKLTSTTRHNDVLAAIPVDAVTFSTNVARVDVVLEVTGKTASGIANDTNLVVKGEVSNAANPVQVPVGETKENYLQKLEDTGFLAQAMTNWGMSTEFYSYEIVNDAQLPAVAGEEKITVKVLVTPKTFKVTEKDFGGDKDVPYGFIYGFAAHPESANDKAYIYTVVEDGATKEQGETYTVTKDVTITRTEDRAKKGVKVNTAVGTTIGANANEMAVLNSDAIPSDTIRVKYPSNADDLAMYTKGTGVVAKAYVSGYTNNWVPFSVTFSDGHYDEFDPPVGDEYIVSYTGDATDAVVEYRLAVDISSTEATTIANYPYVLSKEANQQKSQMDKLLENKGTIESNAGTITLLGSLINDSTYNFTASAVEAFDEFEGACLDGNRKLKLIDSLNKYDNQGLYYYYTGGYEELNTQIPALKNLCEVLYNDNKTQLANIASMTPYKYEEIEEKLIFVINTLNESSLVVPNALINKESQSLSALLTTLVAGGMPEKGTVSEVYLATDINAGKQGESTVTLKVDYNGNVTSSAPITVSAIEKLTQQTYDEIMSKWDDVIADADVDENHFYYVGEEIEGTTPLKVGEYPKTVTYIRTWKPVEYSVTVEGAPTNVTFTYDGADKLITLDGPAAVGERYVYSVAGKTAKAEHGQKATISLTVAEIDSVAAAAGEGKFTINVTRTTEDMSVVNFVEFAGGMNSAFATSDLKAAFMPFEAANGEKVLVMRATYTGEELDMNSLMSPLEKILGDYNYVAMGSNVVVSEQKLSIQGIINEFIDKGFGMNTIEDLVDENGNIKELKLDGAVALIDLSGIENSSLLGGKIIETTLSFGANAETATTVKFYITLEDFDTQANKLKKAEDAIAELSPYIDINSVGNKVQIDMNMPEEIYALYLTYMLAEQEITLDTFNDVELETLFTYAEDVATEMIGDLAEGEKDPNRFFTTLVLENTVNQIVSDKAPDLDKYGSMLKKLVKYTDLILTEIDRENGTYNGNNYTVNLKTDDVEKVLNKINPLATSFVSDTELTVPTSLTLKNVDTDYQAYVITLPESKNITKEDVKNLLRLSKDITADLNAVSGNALVVLLDNATLTKDVVIKGENVVIDLNGFTITGNMNATGRVVVVDDTLSTENAGKVDGTLSGNFKLFAGRYNAVASEMLPAGYVFENEKGYVENKYYYLESTENEGELEEVTIVLKDDVFSFSTSELVNSVVNAVVNVTANLYGYNTAAVNGTTLYSFGDKNVVNMVNIAKTGTDAIINELLGYVNPTAVEEIANEVLATFVGEEDGVSAIVKAAEADKLYSCDLTLSPWNILYSIEGGTSDEPYLNVRYEGDKVNQENVTLSFAMEDELKALLSAVGDVVTINKATVELPDKITYNGGKSLESFGFDREECGGEFEVVVDFTENTDYAIVLAAVLANNGNKDASDAVNDLIDNNSQANLKKLIDRTTVAGLIAALEKANGVEFETMLDTLKINDTERAKEIKDLEAKYDMILKAVYKAAAKLDLTGPSTKLGSFETDEFGVYYKEASKYNVDAKATVKLFLNKAEIVTVTPVIDFVKDKFYGVKLIENEDERTLIIDTVTAGISENDLKMLVQYTVNDATTEYSLAVAAEGLNANGRVKNGAEFTITAKNAISEDIRTYKVIILGDTDSDGEIEVFDAVRIQNHKMNVLTEPLDIDQLSAADTNYNGGIDVGDAVKISVKWMLENSEIYKDKYWAEHNHGYDPAF